MKEKMHGSGTDSCFIFVFRLSVCNMIFDCIMKCRTNIMKNEREWKGKERRHTQGTGEPNHGNNRVALNGDLAGILAEGLGSGDVGGEHFLRVNTCCCWEGRGMKDSRSKGALARGTKKRKHAGPFVCVSARVPLGLGATCYFYSLSFFFTFSHTDVCRSAV